MCLDNAKQDCRSERYKTGKYSVASPYVCCRSVSSFSYINCASEIFELLLRQNPYPRNLWRLKSTDMNLVDYTI